MTTTTDTTVNLTRKGTTFEAGNAALTRPANLLDDIRAFLVTPDQHAAEHFGVSRRANQLVGCIVFHETRRRWAPIAYTNRQNFLDGLGPCYDLPYARSRAAAVRALLRWWNAIDTGRLPADADPLTMSAASTAYLVA